MGDEEDNASACRTNPVIDYYKKYSRNKSLSKYFRGATRECVQPEKDFRGSNDSFKPLKPSVAEHSLPTQAINDDLIDVDIQIELDNTKDKEGVDVQTETDFDTGRVLSPASSVASKKLEWDNGADIGYANISDKNMHKSLSLPTLCTLEKVVSQQYIFRQSPDGKPAESSQNNQNVCNLDNSASETSMECDLKRYTSTSSSSSRKTPAYTTTSSSSSKDYNVESGRMRQSIHTFYQEPTQPLAESTPQACSQKTQETQLITKKKQTKNCKLCLSKPIVIECLANIQSKDKLVQTTLPHNVSACIQTDDLENNEPKQIQQLDYKSSNYIERQNVIYVKHSDDDETEITNSHSFEFIAGGNLKEQEQLKAKSPSPSESPKSSLHSSHTSLSNLIKKKQSNNLINDVDATIELLQQLLHSKNYDDRTKKQYLRKIAKKIVDNKYTDDSISSNGTADNRNDSEVLEQQLQKNVPWKPVEFKNNRKSSEESARHENHLKVDKKQSKNLKELQEENQNRKPDLINYEAELDKSKEELIQPTYEKINKPRHSVFTITNQFVEHSKLSSENNTVNSEPSTLNEMHVSSAFSSLKKTSTSSPDSTGMKKSWRDDKTLSEKLLEEKLLKYTENCGDKPELNFHKFKKENQKNWINNEIHHLHNLRKILEGNQEEIRKALMDKPEPNPRTTAVYVVRNETKRPKSCTSNKSTQYTTEIDLQIGTKKYVLKRQPCCRCKKHICNCIDDQARTTENEDESTPRSTRRLSQQDSVKANDDDSSQKSVQSQKSEKSQRSHQSKRSEQQRKLEPSPISEQSQTPELLRGSQESEESHKSQKSNKSQQSQQSEQLQKSEKLGKLDQPQKYKQSKKSVEPLRGSNGKSASVNKQIELSKNVEAEIIKKPNEPIVIVLKINKEDSDDNYPKSTSTPSSSTSSERVCCCSCKNYFIKSSTLLNEMLSENLCPRCSSENMKTCQDHPNTSCDCYTYVNMKTINDIKKTVKDLDELERQQMMCTCGFKKRNKTCSFCNHKKPFKSVAYTLNLVPEDFRTSAKRKEKRKKPLEEVTIKIPYENSTNKENDSNDDTDESKENIKVKKTKKKRKKRCTLQDYLAENRPDFIQTAEQRRRCMVELAYIRAKRIEKYKRLLALTSNIPAEKSNYNNKKGMFTSKEMKTITAKTYKKLPEVQQKKQQFKKQQINKANRLITNIFNENLRRNVLKGQKDFSTSVSVVNL